MILVYCLMYMRYKASVFLSFMTLWIIMHYYFWGHFSQSCCLHHWLYEIILFVLFIIFAVYCCGRIKPHPPAMCLLCGSRKTRSYPITADSSRTGPLLVGQSIGSVRFHVTRRYRNCAGLSDVGRHKVKGGDAAFERHLVSICGIVDFHLFVRHGSARRIDHVNRQVNAACRVDDGFIVVQCAVGIAEERGSHAEIAPQSTVI